MTQDYRKEKEESKETMARILLVIIIKEKESKEEYRQEEADVKEFFVKNGYADLKRRH